MLLQAINIDVPFLEKHDAIIRNLEILRIHFVFRQVFHFDGTERTEPYMEDKFIFPPYDFKVTDRLVTNFHLPESTLLMLVSAFAGHDFLMRAYKRCIKEGFRFYSYGDAMLLF